MYAVPWAMSAGYALSSPQKSTRKSGDQRQKRRAMLLSFLMIMLVQTAYFTGSPYEVVKEPTEPADSHGVGGSSKHLNQTSLSLDQATPASSGMMPMTSETA